MWHSWQWSYIKLKDGMVELFINGYHLLVLCEVFVPIFMCLVLLFFPSIWSVLCGFWWLAWLGFCLFYIFEVGRQKLHVFPHIIREIWRPDWRIKLLQTNLQTVEESRIRSVMIIFSSGLQFEFSMFTFQRQNVRNFVIV